MMSLEWCKTDRQLQPDSQAGATVNVSNAPNANGHSCCMSCAAESGDLSETVSIAWIFACMLQIVI
jgi:hypothetical protein